MGGYGSGRRDGRPIVEHALQIDMKHLLDQRLLRPGHRSSGTLSWSSSHNSQAVAKIRYEADLTASTKAWLCLRPLPPSGQMSPRRKARLHLAVTVPHYGGLRWWFICPLSGKRARVLYLPADAPMFASRQAYGLAYKSQRRTEVDRLIERARAARRLLGLDEDDLLEVPECPKPTGMHESTYFRLVDEVESLCRQLWENAPM
jgi:hypothetical protein